MIGTLDSIDTQETSQHLNGLDRWRRNVSVSIQIPEGKGNVTSLEGRTFEVPGLHHRSIVQIIQKVYASETNLHFTPSALFHKSDPNAPPQRVYGELFTSPVFWAEHKKLPREPEPSLEPVIAPLLFWSDATHLAQFGTAKLWPYMPFWGPSLRSNVVDPMLTCAII
jgi:Plavaka transposase